MENKVKFEIKRGLNDEENAALCVVKKLTDNGFIAYFAGGAVRDELLGIDAHDIDIATDARPEDIEKIFPKTYSKGKVYGVMCVRSGDIDFEVATFRTDQGTSDHRRPQKVEFTSAQNDALRRDFTINGIFYDPLKNEIIDYVDGLRDIKRNIIRFIGNPEDRINEDYLRILRAIRFSAKLGFEIERESRDAIKKYASKISEISAERVRDEISKMLLSDNRVKAIYLLKETGLLKEILPELSKTINVAQPKEFHSEGDVWNHIMLALKNIKIPPTGGLSEELVWAVLLHDIGKPETLGFRSQTGKTSITFFEHDVRSAEIAKEILNRLNFSNKFIDSVTWAISQHMRIVNAFRGMTTRKQEKLFMDENIQLLLDLTQADLSASLRVNGKPDMKMYESAVKLKEKFEKEASEQEKKQVKKFDLITGNDIIKILKIKPGPEVGHIKTEIETKYLDGKINTRKEALEILEGYHK
jgi:poly(A) polymerase